MGEKVGREECILRWLNGSQAFVGEIRKGRRNGEGKEVKGEGMVGRGKRGREWEAVLERYIRKGCKMNRKKYKKKYKKKGRDGRLGK